MDLIILMNKLVLTCLNQIMLTQERHELYLRSISMNVQEATVAIQAAAAKAEKIRAEVQALREAFDAAQANGAELPQELVDALASLEAAQAATDDINADAVVG